MMVVCTLASATEATTFRHLFKNLDSGAVFRCELDGSNLEVVATGLRNPQELAFDDYGNLFTADNNSDSGDEARFTEIVKGGDSGWRMYYQYIDDRGPFNREKIWYPYNEDTPAYIIPPIANIADGPAGLEYYPGTGFGDEFKDRFFLCDFRGTVIRPAAFAVSNSLLTVQAGKSKTHNNRSGTSSRPTSTSAATVNCTSPTGSAVGRV